MCVYEERSVWDYEERGRIWYGNHRQNASILLNKHSDITKSFEIIKPLTYFNITKSMDITRKVPLADALGEPRPQHVQHLPRVWRGIQG